MIHDSVPTLLFSGCTADRTQVCAPVSVDLQCVLCIANSSYAVKTPKDEVAWHIGIFTKNWKFGHISFKTRDFEIKREDGRQFLKTGVSLSKREGWEICTGLFNSEVFFYLISISNNTTMWDKPKQSEM